MVHREHVHLTRRERQIMDVLYAKGEASVSEVHKSLPDTPSYSAVRAMLNKLLDKGHVLHRREGSKYFYYPVVAKAHARESAVKRLLDTFFSGSKADAVVNLLGDEEGDLTDTDIASIEDMLKKLKSDKSDS